MPFYSHLHTNGCTTNHSQVCVYYPNLLLWLTSHFSNQVLFNQARHIGVLSCGFDTKIWFLANKLGTILWTETWLSLIITLEWQCVINTIFIYTQFHTDISMFGFDERKGRNKSIHNLFEQHLRDLLKGFTTIHCQINRIYLKLILELQPENWTKHVAINNACIMFSHLVSFKNICFAISFSEHLTFDRWCDLSHFSNAILVYWIVPIRLKSAFRQTNCSYTLRVTNKIYFNLVSLIFNTKENSWPHIILLFKKKTQKGSFHDFPDLIVIMIKYFFKDYYKSYYDSIGPIEIYSAPKKNQESNWVRRNLNQFHNEKKRLSWLIWISFNSDLWISFNFHFYRNRGSFQRWTFFKIAFTIRELRSFNI